MTEFFLVLVAAAVIFIFLWIGSYRKRKTQDTNVSFTCGDCGEMDCICYKVDDTDDTDDTEE
ncbi:MAG: hypothetical protein JRE29_02260 [Deltaproteobacteria bacterium]|nr:hypothetical protein [Deltaproteobacteria bacterium]